MIDKPAKIRIGNRALDIVNLPEAAQQELVAFYEFLVFKYQGQEQPVQSEKKRILLKIFQEADGVLPVDYAFDREELHER